MALLEAPPPTLTISSSSSSFSTSSPFFPSAPSSSSMAVVAVCDGDGRTEGAKIPASTATTSALPSCSAQTRAVSPFRSFLFGLPPARRRSVAHLACEEQHRTAT